MALIPKGFIDAVVSIGIKQQADQIAWIGTGFFVHCRINDKEVLPFLVSNKHIFEGKSCVVIRMRETQENKLVLMDVSLSDCRVHAFADIGAVMLSGT